MPDFGFIIRSYRTSQNCWSININCESERAVHEFYVEALSEKDDVRGERDIYVHIFIYIYCDSRITANPKKCVY